MGRPWHLDLAMLGVWMMILLDIAVFVRSIVMCYVGVQHIYAVPQKRRKVKSLGRIQTKEKNPVMDPSFNALFGLRKQSMMFKAGD